MTEEDRRLTHLMTQPYLRGVAFARTSYRPWSATWTHDHCVGCWTEFGPPGQPGADQHEGYATTADFVCGAEYDWVCVTCFDAFHEAMGWVDATRAVAGGSR